MPHARDAAHLIRIDSNALEVLYWRLRDYCRIGASPDSRTSARATTMSDAVRWRRPSLGLKLRWMIYTAAMRTYRARVDKSGRILIPARVRRQLGLSEGSQVLIDVDKSGALHVATRSQALSKVRQEILKYIPTGEDLAEELIRDRR